MVLAVLFITAVFIVNSYAYPGTARTNRIAGFAGVPTSEFSKAKELGAATVQVNTLSASELQFALETAKSFGLGLIGRAEIVDIATFVITPKKLRRSPDYITNEAATAKRVSGPGDYDFSILHDFNIDENSIYATGMSNGAQMCYRLACELADKIAAIAPCGSIGTFDNCTPSRPVPVMHFHGLEDPCSFYGGGQCGTCMAEFLNALGIPAVPRSWGCIPVPAYVDKWRKQNGCSNQTKITFQTGNATCISYQECQNNAEVTICSIAGMGHTWPGSTEYNAEACKTRPNGYVCRLWKEAVGTLSNDIIANDAMWEFFKKHTLNDGNCVCGNGICEPGENISICPEDCKEFANVYLATRIPVKTDAQIQSV